MTGFIGQNSFATGFATCSHALPSLATFFPLLHLSAPRSTCLPPIAITCHPLPSIATYCHHSTAFGYPLVHVTRVAPPLQHIPVWPRFAPFCTILPLFAHLST
ncbi:hypothetical protein L227DRAFT_162772 [Lentinus tigrinus ALCF2SS1-6]|uniref:Uncharacterized protein n=1 Tax=Lentinus tigrinus ALCF2SS1-6 TaxID=1328759 RepID=A0A5C2S6N7_9APHY|nr:hypothetical protein L227DRAFT_162772 [Lentinus tigrinus ALCF2SS1-6]